MRLEDFIRAVPDFPKPGILFRDITPLLGDPHAFEAAVTALEQSVRGLGDPVTKVAAIESRGFLFGGALASRLGVGVVPVRKPGKLPGKTVRVAYELEYGAGELEVHADAIAEGERVLVLDDLLATGGTAGAAGALVRKLGGTVAGYQFVIELADLGGRARLTDAPVSALLVY